MARTAAEGDFAVVQADVLRSSEVLRTCREWMSLGWGLVGIPACLLVISELQLLQQVPCGGIYAPYPTSP